MAKFPHKHGDRSLCTVDHPAIVFADARTAPGWWYTHGRAVLHQGTVTRSDGDGHGPRYVGGCSCERWGTVALIDQHDAVAAVRQHLAYIDAIDAPDSPERTAILKGGRCR